jgi:ribosomal protein S27AE
MTLLLAIDDDPERYADLRRLLGQREAAGRPVPELVIATCHACVADVLPRASAVFLDYDLDYFADDEGIRKRSPCPRCGAFVVEAGDLTDPPRFTGERHLDALDTRGVPVIVASVNRHGAPLLRQALVDRGATVVQIRATDVSAVERWVSALWAWGCL